MRLLYTVFSGPWLRAWAVPRIGRNSRRQQQRLSRSQGLPTTFSHKDEVRSDNIVWARGWPAGCRGQARFTRRP